jgi:hypothetical protein
MIDFEQKYYNLTDTIIRIIEAQKTPFNHTSKSNALKNIKDVVILC